MDQASLIEKLQMEKETFSSEASLLREEMSGARPDVILACDCIFAPLFGDAFLLLRMVLALAAPATRTLVALERRHDDGADAFFAQAHAAGFTAALVARRGRVLVVELARHPFNQSS